EGDDSGDGQEGDGSEDGQDGDDSGDSQDGETSDDGEVTYSYLEDYGSGIVVRSDSSELLDKTLSVELLPDSELIDLPHDLYNIEVLDEEGNEYELTHPVTVTVPANGSVASVYYLGENGEVLEEVSYSEEDGHVSFEASDFSQYAVAYEEGTYANKDGSEDKNGDAPAAASADSGEKRTAPANDVAEQEDDTASGEQASGDQASDEQVSGEKGTAPANDVAGQEDDTASGEQTSDEQVSGEKAE